MPRPLISLAALLLLFGALCASGSTRAADDEQDAKFLGLLVMVRDADDKCRYLTTDERAALDRLLEEGMKRISDEKRRADILRAFSKPSEVDCKAGNYEGFVDMFRMLQASPDNDDDEEDDSEEPTATDEELRKQLETNIGTLPRDRLKQIAGCWQGVLETWTVRFCFTLDGNDVDVTLSSPDRSTSCTFEKGAARRREGRAFLYAFSPSKTCSDGRQSGHLEGVCSGFEERSMNCLLSVYSRGNVFMTTGKDGGDALNGEFSLSRSR